MIKAKNKKLSLLMVIVFAITVLVPAGAVFAADASIGSSYKYLSTGDDKEAGTITVEEDGMDGNTETVTVRLSLPGDVDFEDDPTVSWATYNGVSSVNLIKSDSDYYEVEFAISDTNNFSADFSFTDAKGADLEIGDDFSGNLDVDVEVIGEDSSDILWTESDSVTIAKVADDDVSVIAGDPETVNVGANKEVADITLEEGIGGAFTDGEKITFEIETDGVEFSSVKVATVRLDVYNDESGDTVSAGDSNEFTDAFTDDNKIFELKIDSTSSSLPGEIELDPIKLDIDPDVTGDIEISIYSDDDADIDETVTVATVGDAAAEITDIEDNDTVAYAGKTTELDVEFSVEAIGSDFSDDLFTFTLNQGEFDSLPDNPTGAKLYNSDESFYYVSDGEGDFDVDGITVVLDNDVEPGDLILTVGGDFGDLGEIVIGEVAKPFSVTADKPEMVTEKLGQEAGDIYITETDDGAFEENDEYTFELPSGIELGKDPKIETVEGKAEASIDSDEESFTITIDEESTNEPSQFRIYNLEYDAGKLALTGDVELDIHTGDDDDLLATVVNATVVDSSKVTASFTMGEEGVTIQNGRTLVQVNQLCDTLGLQKSWDAENKIAYFVKSGTVVAFPIDQNKIIINGNEIVVDQGGTIVDGYTYATLRGIQMAFGGELDWDNSTKTATFEFDK